MVKVLDCRVVVLEFELQLRYSVHVWTISLVKVWTPYLTIYGLKSTTIVLLKKGMLYSLHNGLASSINTRQQSVRWVDQTHAFGAFLQLFGRTSASRGFRSVWSSHWPQRAVSQALTLFGGVRLIAWRLRRPYLGDAEGPKVFLENARCV